MKKGIAFRIFLFCLGMFSSAIGVSVITRTDLGTTPVSSFPYVASLLTGFSFGEATFVINCFFVLMQWVLLRRRFSPMRLLQVPAIFAFSVFLDLAMWLTAGLVAEGYAARVLSIVPGAALVGIGVSLQLHSDVTLLPGDGFVQAVSSVLDRPFGTVKVVNDVSFVTLAAILSFVFSGTVVGVREGTLISALLVGNFARLILRRFPLKE